MGGLGNSQGFSYHSMGELKSRGLQGPNDTQWLPDDDIFGIFPSDFRFETVDDPVVR